MSKSRDEKWGRKCVCASAWPIWESYVNSQPASTTSHLGGFGIPNGDELLGNDRQDFYVNPVEFVKAAPGPWLCQATEETPHHLKRKQSWSASGCLAGLLQCLQSGAETLWKGGFWNGAANGLLATVNIVHQHRAHFLQEVISLCFLLSGLNLIFFLK